MKLEFQGARGTCMYYPDSLKRGVWMEGGDVAREAVGRGVEKPKKVAEKCAGCQQPLTRDHSLFRRWVFGLMFVLFGTLGAAVRAASPSVVITEIAAFETSDHEWVEVLNESDAPMDVTGWRFVEDGTNHKITLSRGADSVIAPGEYAVIADVADNFVADYPSYVGKVFDSSWSSLREYGEEIGIADNSGAVVETFTYPAAPDESLHRLEEGWVSGPSTPGGPAPGSGGAPSAVPGDGGDEVSKGEADEGGSVRADSGDGKNASISIPGLVVVSAPTPQPRVVISELYPNPPGGDEGEWIEIANLGNAPAALRGWSLSDGASTYTIDDRMIVAGQYLWFGRSATNIALDNGGDAVELRDAAGRLVSSASFEDEVVEGVSLARDDNGVFAPTASPTPGAANIVITPNQPPIVVVDAPKEAEEGALVLFDATDSIDPDGDPISFHYAFDDGTEARFARTLHAFKAGKRAIVLTVTDAFGHETVKKITLRVGGASEPVQITAVDEQRPRAAERRLAKPRATKSSARALTVSGTVTALPGVLNRRSFLIQNSDGAVEIYQNKAEFPALEAGDRVQVRGRKSKRAGLPRVLVSAIEDIEVLEGGDPIVPVPVSTSALTDQTNGTLVMIIGEVVEVSKNEALLSDGSGEVAVLAPPGGWPEAFATHARVSVAGIVRDTARGRKIQPRSSEDIAIVGSSPIVAAATTASESRHPWLPALPVLGATAIALGTKEVRRRLHLKKIKDKNKQLIIRQEPAQVYGEQTPTYRVRINHADG